MGGIKVVISGPLRLRVGRELHIETENGISIFKIMDMVKERYEKGITGGYQSFKQLSNQIVVLINGERWNKKEDVEVQPGSTVNIIHLLNGG